MRSVHLPKVPLPLVLGSFRFTIREGPQAFDSE